MKIKGGRRALTQDDIERLMPDLSELNRALEREIREQLGELFLEGVETGAGEAGTEVTVDLSMDAAREWLDSYSIRLSDQISSSTDALLRGSLMSAITNGETLGELSERIQDVMGDAANRYRAEMIGRTEWQRAQNAGRLAQLQDAGAAWKVWRVNPEACDFCRQLDGKRVAIDANFAEIGDELTLSDGSKMKLDYSETPHPPLHPHCRCRPPVVEWED